MNKLVANSAQLNSSVDLFCKPFLPNNMQLFVTLVCFLIAIAFILVIIIIIIIVVVVIIIVISSKIHYLVCVFRCVENDASVNRK